MSPALTTGQFTSAVGEIKLTRGGQPGAEPVVFLHSSGGEAGDELAAPFLEALAGAGDVEVFAPMFPGFAGSQGLDQIDDMEDAVYHCLDVFERLGLGQERPPHIVGLSLGGWMAVEIAWRYPAAAKSLILLNAVGLYVPGHPMAELFGRTYDELAEMTFADQSHPVPAGLHALASMSMTDVAAVPFDILRPFFESMAAAAKIGWNPYFHNPKLPKRIGRVTAPALVVAGALDGLVPNAVAEEYARLLPSAALEVVPDASHMLPIEFPEPTADLVLGHVRSVAGQAAVVA